MAAKTPKTIARKIYKAADAWGTIQAEDARQLQRTGVLPDDPRYATAMSVQRAWELAGGAGEIADVAGY